MDYSRLSKLTLSYINTLDKYIYCLETKFFLATPYRFVILKGILHYNSLVLHPFIIIVNGSIFHFFSFIFFWVSISSFDFL